MLHKYFSFSCDDLVCRSCILAALWVTEKFVYNSLHKLWKDNICVILFGPHMQNARRGPLDFCIFWQFG